MKTIQLPGISFPVSCLCLGCAYYGSRESEAVSFQLLDIFYERGGRFLNTAHEYGRGLSEQTIGRWIRDRNVRDEMAITSKIGEDHDKPYARAMKRHELLEDIDETLSRVGYDYIEFALLHIDDPEVSVEEILETMEEIRHAGKILYYGCSNWSVDRMVEADTLAKQHGYDGFRVNEIEMNLARSNPANEVRTTKWVDETYAAYHRKTQMAVGAYSPLASGALTKLIIDSELNNSREYNKRAYATSYNLEIARRLYALSDQTGHASAQIQIAWLLSQPYGFPVFPILGARTPEQLIDCIGSLDIALTSHQLAYLKPDKDLYLKGEFDK